MTVREGLLKGASAIAALAVLITISGCDKKREAVDSCKEFVRSLAYNQDAAYFYSEDHYSSGMSEKDLEAAYVSSTGKEELPGPIKRVMKLNYESSNPPIQHWVDMKFKAIGFKGGESSKIQCVIVDFGKERFFNRINIDGEVFSGFKLLQLVARKAPNKKVLDMLN